MAAYGGRSDATCSNVASGIPPRGEVLAYHWADRVVADALARGEDWLTLPEVPSATGGVFS